MSERIDHGTEVGNCINYARATESSAEAHLSMMQAQVHATLALVEQQRIANLIALWHGSPVKEGVHRGRRARPTGQWRWRPAA